MGKCSVVRNRKVYVHYHPQRIGILGIVVLGAFDTPPELLDMILPAPSLDYMGYFDEGVNAKPIFVSDIDIGVEPWRFLGAFGTDTPR